MRRHDVDAAIFFSDIVVPLRLAGVDVDIVPGVGPVLAHPVRSAADVDRLPHLDPAALAPVREGVAAAVALLGDVPLIGFAGAPFTLASYLVEGRPNRELPATSALLAEDPATWHRLLAWVADLTASFLRAQADAGASALQLFDSWVGRLSPPRPTPTPSSRTPPLSSPPSPTSACRGCTSAPPRGNCCRPCSTPAPTWSAWPATSGSTRPARCSDTGSRCRATSTRPCSSADWASLEAATRDIVRRGAAAPGHVFNLGHGVPPDTDPAFSPGSSSWCIPFPQDRSTDMAHPAGIGAVKPDGWAYQRSPMIVYWELTNACGLACRHCRATAMPDAAPGELTTAQAIALLDDITGFGDAAAR